MVAQMILVHLVGVRIPAGELFLNKGFPLGKPLFMRDCGACLCKLS